MRELQTISAFIVEDEQPARELLIEYVLLREELKLEGMAQNGEDAVQKLLKKNYDLLFLDISLPVISGIEVLDKLDSFPYVIFTTAFDQYAIKAFDLGAVDYLLKPFTLDRFNQAVDKALSIIKGEKPYFDSPKSLGLSFKENNKHYIIAFDDIVYLSSNAKQTVVHTEMRDFETQQLLKDLGIKLPEDHFIRIHKQFIVNLSYVSRMEYTIGGQYEATLKDDEMTKLPVGVKYAPDMKKKLNI